MKWLLLVALVACEKDRSFHVPWKLPATGDREAYHARSDTHFTASDGSEHEGHQELTMTLLIEAATKGRVERMRVVIDRHDHVIDHVQVPTLSGSYEVTADGTATRADGKPLSDDEAKFFGAWHIGNDVTPLYAHEFHAGDTYRPSTADAETIGLPLASSPWVLQVRIAAATEIQLAGDYTPSDTPPDAEAHGTTVVTMTPLHDARVDDVVLRRQGNDVGGGHMTTELRTIPQR